MGLSLGRYETIRPIASGGMATVHLGRAVGAGGFERLVAIKVLHPHVEAEPDFIAMFLDEARLAAQIRHPNVVATIDVSSSPLFLVMEFVEGPSLHAVQRDVRKQQKVVPIDVALHIICDVLAGLQAAHDLTDADGQSLGLVHRDVTPHNVLLGADGISRITDFGVARAEARLSSTQGGQVKGKIPYMSSEQLLSAPVDRRSDVYAAGVVLHELLTSRPLFAADNEAALVVLVAKGARVTPREINPEIPAAIDAVCMKALASAAEDRYASASDFADALEEAARSSGVSIATNKGVASFVRLLSIHESPRSGRGQDSSIPSGVGVRTPSSSAPSTGSGPAPATNPSSISTAVGAEVAPSDEVVLPTNAGRGKLIMASAGGFAAVLVIGYVATRGPSPTPAVEPARSAAAVAAAPPAPQPPTQATISASASSSGPGATASATTSSPVSPGRPRQTPMTGTPPKAGAKAFRPGEL